MGRTSSITMPSIVGIVGQFWGLYSHISSAINVKFGTGERTEDPLPHAKFHVYQGNVSPLWGKKPIFGH